MPCNYQLHKELELTKSSGKKMSPKIAVGTVESRCLSKFVRQRVLCSRADRGESPFSKLLSYPRLDIVIVVSVERSLGRDLISMVCDGAKLWWTSYMIVKTLCCTHSANELTNYSQWKE